MASREREVEEANSEEHVEAKVQLVIYIKVVCSLSKDQVVNLYSFVTFGLFMNLANNERSKYAIKESGLPGTMDMADLNKTLFWRACWD